MQAIQRSGNCYPAETVEPSRRTGGSSNRPRCSPRSGDGKGCRRRRVRYASLRVLAAAMARAVGGDEYAMQVCAYLQRRWKSALSKSLKFKVTAMAEEYDHSASLDILMDGNGVGYGAGDGDLGHRRCGLWLVSSEQQLGRWHLQHHRSKCSLTLMSLSVGDDELIALQRLERL